ncbi:hypothetical protein PM082_010058 [Marasmius tenuissimus]|nr:hypothetical protein PM082_010058 [Marasmius tenuissimus]
MDPSLKAGSKSPASPRGAKDIGGGYSMRRATDSTARPVTSQEMTAIRVYLRENGLPVDDDYVLKVTRWARVGLPNGQIARSRWKEDAKGLENVRMARNVQLELNSERHLAEVHFYMNLSIHGIDHHLAVGSFYGPPHQGLYNASSKTYISVQHQRDVDVRVFPITAISCVVMMAPDPRYSTYIQDGSEVNRYFMMSRPGLKVAEFTGIGLEEEEEENTGGGDV